MIVILGGPTRGNQLLAAGLEALGLEAALVSPCDARVCVRADDVVIARPDVRPSLDGVEECLEELVRLERRGVRVVNSARSLVTVHDKLRTARTLDAAGLPHPRTVHARDERALAETELPAVVKPRFGSWGRDVTRCRDRHELEQCILEVRSRPWFARHGALVQDMLPLQRRDLRIVVAGGVAVGAAERVAAPGEWRTNVSLGGEHHGAVPPAAACDLAVSAARAAGSDLVGVDLFPVPAGWTVLELNAAVEFDGVYSLPGGDVYAAIAEALALDGVTRAATGSGRRA